MHWFDSLCNLPLSFGDARAGCAWRKTDGGKWERKEKKENGNGNGNLREGRKGGGEGSERRDPDEREGNDERTRDCEEA